MIGYAGKAQADAAHDAQNIAIPLKIATSYGIMSFIGTTTVFGTPTEVTLSELALEMWFPEDAEVVDVFAPPREDFLTGEMPAYMRKG